MIPSLVTMTLAARYAELISQERIMLNWKYILVCGLAGLTSLVGLFWLIDDVSPFWWIWWVITTLCGYVVVEAPVTGSWAKKAHVHKTKVGIPAFLLGADTIMIYVSTYGVWSSYYYGGGYNMGTRACLLCASSIIALLLFVIIRMNVKALPST